MLSRLLHSRRLTVIMFIVGALGWGASGGDGDKSLNAEQWFYALLVLAATAIFFIYQRDTPPPPGQGPRPIAPPEQEQVRFVQPEWSPKPEQPQRLPRQGDEEVR